MYHRFFFTIIKVEEQVCHFIGQFFRISSSKSQTYGFRKE